MKITGRTNTRTEYFKSIDQIFVICIIQTVFRIRKTLPNIRIYTCQFIFSCIINDIFYYKIGSCFKQQQDNHFVEYIKRSRFITLLSGSLCVCVCMFCLIPFFISFVCCLYICHCCGVPFVVIVVVVILVCHKQFFRIMCDG